MEAIVGTFMAWVVIVFVCLIAWGCPHYNVWEQRLAGEAKLAESESSKRIAIEDAKAKYESAEMLAKAEVARARGVAEANKIIGDSLKGNESYLRYLWIENLDKGQNQVIYVPTEAGLPVLEAGKRHSND